jgi:uncharacterized protein
MRILILSDTHTNYPTALKAVEELAPFDEIIHLGDELEDAVILEQITGRRFIKVLGNCDYMAKGPRELCIGLGSRRIFITHGDRYQVKSGLEKLHKKALAERAHIALYGHSHRASIDTIDGVLFINPGCTVKSPHTEPTCAILTIENGHTNAEIASLKKFLPPDEPEPCCF